MSEAERILVCKVGRQSYYGSEREAVAARLEPGDRVVFRDIADMVKLVWFYDGIVVDLQSGRRILPDCDEFEVVHL